MKKVCSAVVMILCFLFTACFTACGKEEEQQHFDIQTEKKTFYDVVGANPNVSTSFLNMQFYQDEPVQIWVVYDGVKNMNVFLYRIDGSRELLLEDVPMEYTRGGGYIDREGSFYYWALNQNSLIKVDPSGNQLFDRPLSELGIFKIERMYQLGNGRIYVKCMESSEGGPYRLYELDPAKGEISRIDSDVSEMYDDVYVAAGEECLLYMTGEGIRKVDVERATQEEVWSFVGTSYTGVYNRDYPIWDFRIKEDDSLELLEAGNLVFSKGADGAMKTLRKIAIGEEREILILRGSSFVYDEWIKSRVRRFNEKSEEWYVILEDCEAVNQSWEDYARQTSVEIAAGKGPDILYGDVLMDYTYDVSQKGGLADLSPYLEASGLNKEDFFSCAFGRWQSEGKIYSISINLVFWDSGAGSILMDASVLGENKEPDIRMLVDALLAWQEDATLMEGTDSRGILELLLGGTEDLWGMVDWEKGICDFGTELFAGILEVARRYGETGENDAPPLAEAETYNIYKFQDKAVLEKTGKVRIGILFDDGCHAKPGSNRVLAINANSERKDGAWEFIRFILEEGQGTGDHPWMYPAGKKAFDSKMKTEMSKELWHKYNEVNEGGKIVYYYPLSEERIAEIKEALEDARYAPVRTQPILDIIYEEAGGYFSGTKGIDETIRVISNRVQLYLDENHL